MTEEETNSVGRNCISQHAPQKRKMLFGAAAGRLSPWKQWRRWLSLFSLCKTHCVLCCVATSKMWRQKVWHALLLNRWRGGGAGSAGGWLYTHDVRCKMKKAAARGCFEPAKLFGPRKKSGVSPFRGYEIIISKRNWQYFWPKFNCTRTGPTRGASGNCCFLAWKCSTRRERSWEIMLNFLQYHARRAARVGILAFL